MAPTQDGFARPSPVRQLQQVLEAHWGGPVYLALRHYAPELLRVARAGEGAESRATPPAGPGRLAWGWGGMAAEPVAVECRRLLAFVRGELGRVWGRT